MSKNFVQAIDLVSIDAATFTGNLQIFNTNGLDEACTIIRIINDCDEDVTISYDGTTEHDYVRSGDTLQLDFQQNSLPGGRVSMMKQGTVLWISGAAGTGFVYLAGYYNAAS